MAYRLDISWHGCEIHNPQVLKLINYIFIFIQYIIKLFRVPEYQKINNIVRDYFTSEFHDDDTKEKMQFYVSAGIKGVIFLMKTPYGKLV